MGLSIKVIDVDPDYLGIEIHASNGRYSGSAPIYADHEQLSDVADHISGFPANPREERIYEFGEHGPAFAGGYCRIALRCSDQAGHIVLEVLIEDYDKLTMAQFSFQVEAAAIDEFAGRLRGMERARQGEARLRAV